MMQPRPLSPRKTVQLMVIVTILAWATQTLLSQWGYGQTIEIRCEATIDGSEVTLRQLCRWDQSSGIDARGDLVVAKLTSNQPVKQVGMNEIKTSLKDAGVNLTTIEFAGAASCAVRQSGVDDETFARLIAKDAVIETANASEPVEAPAMEESVGFPEIRAAVEAVAITTQPAFKKQLVLTRALSVGQKVLASDVVVQALVENGDATTPEVNPDEIIGALLLKDMKRGEVLAAASVKAAPLVLKDQFITIAFSHNGQVVETVARALEDGIKGQTIQVRNEATREIYKVTVTAEAAGTVNGSTGVAFTE